MRSLLAGAFAVLAVVFGTYSTQASAAVPAHGRAWELVTVNPPSSSRVPGLWPVSIDGDSLIFATVGPPERTKSGAALGYALSARGSAGWTNEAIGLPYEGKFEGLAGAQMALAPILPVGFSADKQTKLWLASVPLLPGAPPEGDLSLYRQLPDGTLEFIAKLLDADDGLALTYEYFNKFTDISSDGSRVIFASSEHLLPADAARTEGTSVYAWDAGGLELLDVDAGGTPLSTCGARVSEANGMSASAERVYLIVSPVCGGLQEVYLADLGKDTRTKISASACSRVDCNAAADVAFAGATPDGRFAYLTTKQQLTNADEDEGRDLYRYDANTSQLTLISGAPSAVSGEVVEQKWVFPSEAGERVYFRATGEMLPGESTTDEKLFMVDSGGLHLVADASFPEPVEIQLSAAGKRALFVTQTPIDPGDTDQQGDVYLYDAPAGTVTSISRGSSGGNDELPARIEAQGPLSRWELQYGNTQIYHAIDAAGDRVVFQTEESLIPEDTNTVADIYEWWNGNLGLVSPGGQPQRSELGGMSRDGRSVVFGTNASLLGRDADGNSRDLYIARLGGGFPEPPEPPKCDAVTCAVPFGERLATATPPTLSIRQDKRGALRILEVASKAKKGAIAVVASVPAPGVVSAQVSIRQKGKKVVLAQGSARAKQAGKVQLKLNLTQSARRSSGGPKEAQLTLKQGPAQVSQTVKVSL